MGVKKIITVLIGIFVILMVIFYLQSKKEEIDQWPIQEEVAKPWVEIITPSIFELKSAGEFVIRELRTGDEVEPGNIIQAEETGFANIHFGDGSLLRVEPNTKFFIKESQFDKSNKKLIVRARLLFGRLWSKVLAFSSSDSAWEIETTNVLATVRGTSFGVEYSEAEGKSFVFGSVREVEVKTLDPKTGEAIKDAKVVISPDKFIEINNEDIQVIKENPQALVAKEATPEILEIEWIKRNREIDASAERLESINLTPSITSTVELTPSPIKTLIQTLIITITLTPVPTPTLTPSPILETTSDVQPNIIKRTDTEVVPTQTSISTPTPTSTIETTPSPTPTPTLILIRDTQDIFWQRIILQITPTPTPQILY